MKTRQIEENGGKMKVVEEKNLQVLLGNDTFNRTQVQQERWSRVRPTVGYMNRSFDRSIIKPIKMNTFSQDMKFLSMMKKM